ncbi:acyl-CoA dehydrogenase family protein [Nocardioides sp. Bht2]|uniref:acyl-CoA dehydrogenase family protein n=1 Tax=Nocardioides sp. Bht2 TaxID=3392297 RepID=UPI0039B60D73
MDSVGAARDLISAWRSEGRFTPSSDAWLRCFDPAFSKELAQRGLIGMTWPRSVGGAGRTHVDRLAVTEELLRAGAPVAAHWIGDRQIGPAILRHGSPELRDEILPAIISADALFCLGMSEPEAGSDLADVRTKATETPEGWRISGRKIWTSHAHRATHCYVLARSEAGPKKHHGLSEFIVDMDSPGISISPIHDLSGEHHFNEVTFDDVLVPAHRLLGVAGQGWRQVIEQLSFERGGPERILSTYPVLNELIATVPSTPEAQSRVGALVAQLASLRQLAWRVARALDAGRAPVQEAAALKFLGNAFEVEVIETYRALCGPGSGSRSSAFGQALLASPGFSLRGGSSDVLLSIIAKQEIAL